MADYITQVGGAKQPDTTSQKPVSRVADESGSQADRAPAVPEGDQVVLSEIGKRAANESGFDPAKVEAIRQAISEGNYPLDAKKIAESFSSLEKLIGDTA